MKQTLTLLQILFFGLLIGPAMLMAVAYILHQTGGFTPSIIGLDEILLMVVLAYMVTLRPSQDGMMMDLSLSLGDL